MATLDAPGDMMIDPTHIVGKVSVHRECSLHWASLHDSLLDAFLATRALGGTRESVLVAFEVVVRGLRIRVALTRALRGGLLFAAGLAFSWVGVLALRSMVVAVGKRELRATAESTEVVGMSVACLGVLLTGHCTLAGDVIPWCGDLSPLASIEGSTEADILRGEWDSDLGLGGDAETIGGGGGSSESPAAATHALVADIVDDLGATGPVLGRVEGFRDGVVRDVGDMTRESLNHSPRVGLHAIEGFERGGACC